MQDPEPSLLQGWLLCIFDSETIRLQTSQWKRNLLLFMSGACLEIAALPYLADWLGYGQPASAWLLTAIFLPLGFVGLYASKFGTDRLVEFLLVVSKK